jgi:hypothetical protein
VPSEMQVYSSVVGELSSAVTHLAWSVGPLSSIASYARLRRNFPQRTPRYVCTPLYMVNHAPALDPRFALPCFRARPIRQIIADF